MYLLFAYYDNWAIRLLNIQVIHTSTYISYWQFELN